MKELQIRDDIMRKVESLIRHSMRKAIKSDIRKYVKNEVWRSIQPVYDVVLVDISSLTYK